jgi:hypothetical protein
MNLTKKDNLEIIENAISWIVVIAMLIYGVGKIVQFEDAIDVDKTFAEMTGMELMWAFYSYSKPYVITIEILEVMGGILILIKKTRLIGCLFTTPILLTVILQDFFYGVHLGALKAAIIYQLLILTILWLNKEKIISSIKILLTSDKTKQSKTKFVVKILIAFGIFVGLRFLEYFITIKW